MRAAMRRPALAQIRYVAPVRSAAAAEAADTAGGALVGAVYRQTEREFGVLAPPIALHSPSPQVTAAAWLMLRETLLVPDQVARPVKEAVACGVSLANSCPFCVSVHGATLRGFAGGRAASAIARGRFDEVRDPAVRAAAVWAHGSAPGALGPAPSAPFPLDQAPEYVGVAVTFHYLNRMVNTFLEDAPMPPSAPRRGLAVVERVLSAMIRASVRHVGAPGAALELLAAGDSSAGRPVDLPAGPALTAGTGRIAQALTAADVAIERAGRRSVPEPVRALVLAQLDGWDGRPKPPSRSWVEAPLERIGPRQRAAGRLALLVALASYQIDPEVIRGFRDEQPDDDAALVETAAWAALAAARRAARRLAPPDDLSAGARGGDPEARPMRRS